MPRPGLTFVTPLGWCGITWSEAGVTGVRLPPVPPAPADGGPAPGEVQVAVRLIRRLLGGAPADLSSVPVDLEGVPPFDRDVYEALRRVPAGATTTYGELARDAGHPGEARAVGRALARNPVPLVVPCHRVLAAGGRLGGFSAPGGAATKSRLLVLEGSAIA